MGQIFTKTVSKKSNTGGAEASLCCANRTDAVFYFNLLVFGLICYSNVKIDARVADGTRLAGALMSLYRRAGAASLALRRQLIHLVPQALKAVQPAKRDAKWSLSFFLVVRLLW